MTPDFERADPVALAAFDPRTKACTMNCAGNRILTGQISSYRQELRGRTCASGRRTVMDRGPLLAA